MSSHPWTAERRLGAKQAATLIRRQFPDVACETVERLGEGWDFFMFRVDRTLAFRFPKRAVVEQGVDCELAVLDRLPHDLPLAVPRPLYRGEPNAHFPWRFWGYRLIEGRPLTGLDLPPTKRLALAERVAKFLSKLHATPGEGLPPSPWTGSETPAEVEALASLGSSRDAYPAALLQCCQKYLSRAGLPPAFTGEARLVHGDLLAEHILMDPRRFEATGIIDWGDCTVGDPAGDFVGLWMWGGDQVLETAITSYGGALDPGARRRIRHRAILVAVQDVHYGLKAKRRDLVAAGLATLARELLR